MSVFFPPRDITSEQQELAQSILRHLEGAALNDAISALEQAGFLLQDHQRAVHRQAASQAHVSQDLIAGNGGHA